MKLFVRWVDFDGGRRLAIVSEDGSILPMQRSVRINSVPNDVVTVIVEFIVGKEVQIDAPSESNPNL